MGIMPAPGDDDDYLKRMNALKVRKEKQKEKEAEDMAIFKKKKEEKKRKKKMKDEEKKDDTKSKEVKKEDKASNNKEIKRDASVQEEATKKLKKPPSRSKSNVSARGERPEKLEKKASKGELGSRPERPFSKSEVSKPPPRSNRSDRVRRNSDGKKSGTASGDEAAYVSPKGKKDNNQTPSTPRQDGARRVQSAGNDGHVSPLKSIMDSRSRGGLRNSSSVEDTASAALNQLRSTMNTGKTMDEMIASSWIKPDALDKEDLQREKKEDKVNRIANKEGVQKERTRRKGKYTDDEDSGYEDSRKRTNGPRRTKAFSGDESEASIVKPKTTKVSAEEWDDFDDASDIEFPIVKKPDNQQLSWFGFSSNLPAPADSSMSDFDASFSTLGQGDLDDSISVFDLMNDQEKRADSISSHDETSGAETDDDPSGDDGATSRDGRRSRQRAANLHRLRRKEKQEEMARRKLEDRSERSELGSRNHRSLVRNEPMEGSRRQQQQQQPQQQQQQQRGGGALGGSRQGGFRGSAQQRGGGPRENHWTSDDENDYEGSFRRGAAERRMRGKSVDGPITGEGDRRGGRRMVQRSRSDDGSGLNFNGSRRGGNDGGNRSNLRQLSARGNPFDDGESRREGSRGGRRTADSYDDDGGSVRSRRTVGGGFDDGGSRRGRRTEGGDPFAIDMNSSKRGGTPYAEDMNGSRRGRRTAGGDLSSSRQGRSNVRAGVGDPFSSGSNGMSGSRHGRDLNSSLTGSRRGRVNLGAGGGDPFNSLNTSRSGHRRNADPFDDFNSSQGSLNSHGSNFTAGSRSRRTRNHQEVAKSALLNTLNASGDKLALVEAGKWMEEKAKAPPKIQAWEKRRHGRG